MAEDAGLTPRRERATLVLLAFITLFLFADQNLMAPNLTQIANDFGFGPEERDTKLGGNIALAFWLIGGVVSLYCGYLTDRFPRKWLFVAVVIIGEIPCLLTGFARTYDELFWLRALTGLGMGGMLPLVYSLLGDYSPARSRAAAAAVTGFAMGCGVGGGQLLAGFIGPTYGWRLPFILVALPNFVLVPIFALTAREPARGRTEEALQKLVEGGGHYAEKLDWARYKALFRTKTNLLVFLQGIPGTVPWGMFFVFFNDYFAQDKGYSVEKSTLLVMAVGGAAIGGVLGGGFLGNRLYARNPAYLGILCGGAALFGIIPTVLLINYPAHVGPEPPTLLGAILLAALTGFVVTIPAPNLRAMLMNVNPPEVRGSVFSLYNLADDLGKGFGPALIALLITAFGRTRAFNVAASFWLLSGAAMLALARVFPADERALQARLLARTELARKP